MPPRRTHKKSRKGCLQCKQRRVKCDEKTPVCGNCTKRELDCSYREQHAYTPINYHDTSLSGGRGTIRSPATTTSTGTGGRSSAPIRPSSSGTNTPASNVVGAPDVIYPAASGSQDKGQHLLDLEMLHLYTTVTYRSCVGMIQSVETGDLWQKYVPRKALQYDFLLQALLAFAALHMTTLKIEQEQQKEQQQQQQHQHDVDYSSRPEAHIYEISTSLTNSTRPAAFYLRKALEYQNRAVTLFRGSVQDVTPENCSAVFAFSSITMLFAMAVPGIEATISASSTLSAAPSASSSPFTFSAGSPGQSAGVPYRQNLTPMESIFALFEYLRGVAIVSGLGREALRKSPFRLILDPYAEYASGNWRLTDPDLIEALKRLATLNEELNKPALARNETSPTNQSYDRPHWSNDNHNGCGGGSGGDNGGRDGHDGDRPPKTRHQIYEDAIRHLEWCYSKQEPPLAILVSPGDPALLSCSSTPTPTATSTPTPTATNPGPDRGHIIGWIGMAGPDFVSQLRQGESFALLIFSHWAVMLDLLDMFWWSHHSGRALVAEVADMLHPRGPEWEERTRWVRRKVGLL
ncbi:hypothetical protein HRR83_001146 [Exophiala dermatitidis]|uniref:Zn(2)-C6 fungal-type domain-containing protein n=2 Tax=Exophiala dermatitidis TaxID=5970 RepID=H6C783_EXODN|nr:uncharacterized protein HMPREF1120_07565 [Exophiala dermatitidis NIH/UT8656]KAJ4522656.1 hypothetical protein HRR75_001050 [Exophiala dermatitidis]EHY59579.1 hypothetical protein HMPREF1120_07565 [Exophiala dermatitidis NIH/UT8656]KAJ4525957.1 hypothetical protein HRR74_001150 [Exophiala dermatitidis]KAJ4527096.1 hypothetical protein HRR73_001893 [Exophiala dermatitidis]KAJ4532814.1 hypothetical protein HRR76_007794 [Exophiala dermatitidis]